MSWKATRKTADIVRTLPMLLVPKFNPFGHQNCKKNEKPPFETSVRAQRGTTSSIATYRNEIIQ